MLNKFLKEKQMMREMIKTNDVLNLFLEKYRNKGYGKALLSEAIKANFPKQKSLRAGLA